MTLESFQIGITGGVRGAIGLWYEGPYIVLKGLSTLEARQV